MNAEKLVKQLLKQLEAERKKCYALTDFALMVKKTTSSSRIRRESESVLRLIMEGGSNK